MTPSDDVSPCPVVVIVSGPPCAGKTTLARRLAADLSLPLMTKDTIKETLFDALGCGDVAWSRQLGAASMELLHNFVEAQVRAGRSCIVEANFRSHLATPALLAISQRHPFAPVQIQLRTAASVLVERWHHRALTCERHPGHLDQLACERLGEGTIEECLEPLAIGGELIEVDTTDFGAVDYRGLLARLQRAHHQLRGTKDR